MEITAANVESAVVQFYADNNAVQAPIHQWLMSAQTSPQAWNFVWELLDSNRATEVQYYAASTLHVKVTKYWHEIPPEEYENLRNRILQYLIAGCSNNGHKIVLNRLCTALACCALQSVPEHWQDPISDLISAMHSSSPDNLTFLILLVFTVIPEEFQTMHFPQGKRGTIRHILQEGCDKVLQLAQHWLSQNTSREIMQQSVSCVKAWIQLGVSVTQMESLSNVLLSVAEREMRGDWQIGEIALDALAQMGTHPEVSKVPGTLMRMINRWLSLFTPAQQLANEGDLDAITSVYRLLISVVEAHSRQVLIGLLPPHICPPCDPCARETCQQLVQVVLSCSAVPGQFPITENVSDLTFSFWYQLQDDLVSVQLEWYKFLRLQLQPIYRTLSESLLNKSILPADLHTWNSEDQEKFRCYRQDIADTMVYCYTVLEDNMLELLLNRLNYSLPYALTDWRQLEVILHGFYAVAEVVGQDEITYLPLFFAKLNELPAGVHIKVISTALDAIGAYAEWINSHPEILGQVMPLIITGLQSPDAAASATLALKDLTRDCQTYMKPFADVILQASRDALQANRLRHTESIRLMYAVGKVLSILPNNSILQQLELLVTPYILEIRNLLQNQQINAVIKTGLLLRLKMLAMLFATLNTRQCEDEDPDVSEGSSEYQLSVQSPINSQREPQPVYLVLERVLPDLTSLAATWGNDPFVMDALYAVLKNAVVTLLDECRPLLREILNLLVNSFKLNPQASALDLAKQFLVIFGSEEVLMQQLLCELVESTLSLCAESLTHNTELVEALLVVLSQVLKKAPRLLMAESLNLTSLFQCAIEALGLPEPPTVKAAVAFLSAFIGHSRDFAPLQVIVTQYGWELNRKVISCIGGENTRAIAEILSDILLVLNKKYFDNQTRWLHELLISKNDAFPSPKATKEQKVKFAKMVLKERTNKRRMQEIVREFSLACRGLLGTEYGSQVAQYF